MSRHHAHAAPLTAASADSLRGVVSVTGTSFEQQIVLRADSGTVKLVASANDSASLTRVGGTEVVVFGRTGERAFKVDSFKVRAVGGAPVVDGQLRREGGRLVLRTSSGVLPLGNPPAGLDSLVGAQLWISGSLSTGPNTYGVISSAP